MVFYPANVIATANGLCKRTVQRCAIRERWPAQRRGNRFEYAPPRALQGKCRRFAARCSALHAQILSHAQRAEIARATHRLHAIAALAAELRSGTQRERAVAQVARAFNFVCSPTSLRRWDQAYQIAGFSGLMEKKRGNSGRKPRKS